MKEKRSEISLLPVLADVICIIAALALGFIKGFEIKYISMGLFIALLVCGVISVVLYFTRESYKKVMNYSFSVGVLMIAVACCILARIDDVTAQMSMILALVTLTLSVVILQNSIQMKILGSKIWVAALVIALGFIVANVILIIEPAFIKDIADKYLNIMMFLTGICGLIFMIAVKVEISLFAGREQKLVDMPDEFEGLQEEYVASEKEDTFSEAPSEIVIENEKPFEETSEETPVEATDIEDLDESKEQ